MLVELCEEDLGTQESDDGRREYAVTGYWLRITFPDHPVVMTRDKDKNLSVSTRPTFRKLKPVATTEISDELADTARMLSILETSWRFVQRAMDMRNPGPVPVDMVEIVKRKQSVRDEEEKLASAVNEIMDVWRGFKVSSTNYTITPIKQS